ncbi:tetratricopeptide repeat protein [Candidatus Poribacteria bacterium]|nr:tetratricopeptide repeat protein [Candidatus Poribacteria bacterium]
MKSLLAILLIGVSGFLFACASQTHDLDETIASHKQAVRLNLNSAEAHNNLGIAYLEGGKLDEAIAAFKMAIRINPNFTEAYYYLADAYSLKKEKTLSLESLQQAMKLDGSYFMDPILSEGGRIRSLPNWDRNIPGG